MSRTIGPRPIRPIPAVALARRTRMLRPIIEPAAEPSKRKTAILSSTTHAIAHRPELDDLKSSPKLKSLEVVSTANRVTERLVYFAASPRYSIIQRSVETFGSITPPSHSILHPGNAFCNSATPTAVTLVFVKINCFSPVMVFRCSRPPFSKGAF